MISPNHLVHPAGCRQDGLSGVSGPWGDGDDNAVLSAHEAFAAAIGKFPDDVVSVGGLHIVNRNPGPPSVRQGACAYLSQRLRILLNFLKKNHCLP